MRQAHRAWVLCAVLAPLAGCKTRAGSSDLATYESPEYAGQDVCRLVKAEAARVAEERQRPIADVYAEVHGREQKIFSLLSTKAKLCQSQSPAMDPKEPGQGPKTEAAQQLPAGELADESADAPGPEAYPAGEDAQCDGLTDPARIAQLAAGLKRLQACAPEPREPESELGGFALGDHNNSENQAAAGDSEICKMLGVDGSLCRSASRGAITITQSQVDKLCLAAGAVLKAQPLGKYDHEADRTCGAEIVKDICSKNVAIAAAIAKSSDDGSRKLDEKVRQLTMQGLRLTGGVFTDSLVKCVKAYGKEKAKQAIAQATAETVKSAFGARLDQAETFLRNKRTQAVVAIACGVGSAIAEATMGRYKAENINAECKDVWKKDKQRAQACVATVKDFACDGMAGNIDLGTSFNIGDKNSAARLVADLTSDAVWSTCSATAGKVGSAACSLIAKSGGYIVDALRGKSNPWADCIGTPALGACVADQWHYWSTGVQVDDYKVGVKETVQPSGKPYYENKVCWCWRRCMSNDWGTDREIHKGLHWETATQGEAGQRFCASKQRHVTYPVGGLTFENGRRNVYIQYTDCEVSDARGSTPYLWDDEGYMQISAGGRWNWYKFPRGEREAWGCGGKTDQRL